MKGSENTNSHQPGPKTDTHEHGPYELQTNSEGVTVRFKSGVNVRLISQGASRVNLSLVVSEEQQLIAVQALHDAFFS